MVGLTSKANSFAKRITCVFFDDVICSFREEGFGIMDRCFRCDHFFRFLSEMEKEEDEFWEEVDKLRADRFCVICARKLDDESRRRLSVVCNRCAGQLES